jgi:hypothetical protein
MAREALGIVGAAVGFVAGGPMGAAIGYSIGSGVGGFLDPVKIKGPGLNDAPVQTSRDGIPIAIVWGLHGGIHGNILQKNPEEIVTTTERQGKGGGPEVETQQRYRTFAIGFLEGPISGYSRIWENNKLVYDNRTTPAIPAAETAAYADGITIYVGDEDQLPDPELEVYWTAAETPAYRGLSYIVWNNKDLTDFGGAIPQYVVEVNGSRDLTVTSQPYPIELIDEMIAPAETTDADSIQQPQDALEMVVTPLDGSLSDVFETYSYTEAIETTVTPLDSSLTDVLEEYAAEEAIETEVTPLDGSFGDTLIDYDYPAEAIETTVTPLDGTLV